MITPVLFPVSPRSVDGDAADLGYWANKEALPLLRQLRRAVNSGLGWFIDVRVYGAAADTGKTDNTAAFAKAFQMANDTSSLVYVPYPGVGNEYRFATGSAALPVLTTSPGIVGDPGTQSIIKFNRDGDGVVLKGIGKTVANVEIDNLRSSSFSARSACLRIKNSAYGIFDNIGANAGSVDCDNIMLEQEYTVADAASDAYLLAHIGCWYNVFRNLKLNYVSLGSETGYGLSFVVNANAQGVVNPVGQAPGVYTGSVSYNTVHAVNIEGRERGINIDIGTANYFAGGQILGGKTSIYGRNAQGNTFVAVKCNQWNVATGAALDFDSATSRCNAFLNLTFFNITAQPWPLGPGAATIDDTLGLLPIWLGSGDGISPSVYEGMNIPRGGNVGGIELRTNNIVVPGNYMRQDGAGVALTLGNGTCSMYGDFNRFDPTGASRFETTTGGSSTTTTAALTDVATYQLPSDASLVIEFSTTARRTGGARGTGAVGDVGAWKWHVHATMVGANTGTPTITGTTGFWGAVDATYVSADLTAATTNVPVPVAAAGGLIKVTATAGAANINLTWKTQTRVLSVNS